MLREKRKQKELERKEAMAIPVAPIPEKELCPYEQMREDNIKEREAAMAECKFFESLNCMKKEMGLTNNAKKDEVNENKQKRKTKKKVKKVKKKEAKLDQTEKKVETKRLQSKERESTQKEIQSANMKKMESGNQQEDYESSLKHDYSEVLLSDAWLYFDMM